MHTDYLISRAFIENMFRLAVVRRASSPRSSASFPYQLPLTDIPAVAREIFRLHRVEVPPANLNYLSQDDFVVSGVAVGGARLQRVGIETVSLPNDSVATCHRVQLLIGLTIFVMNRATSESIQFASDVREFFPSQTPFHCTIRGDIVIQNDGPNALKVAWQWINRVDLHIRWRGEILTAPWDMAWTQPAAWLQTLLASASVTLGRPPQVLIPVPLVVASPIYGIFLTDSIFALREEQVFSDRPQRVSILGQDLRFSFSRGREPTSHIEREWQAFHAEVVDTALDPSTDIVVERDRTYYNDAFLFLIELATTFLFATPLQEETIDPIVLRLMSIHAPESPTDPIQVTLVTDGVCGGYSNLPVLLYIRFFVAPRRGSSDQTTSFLITVDANFEARDLFLCSLFSWTPLVSLIYALGHGGASGLIGRRVVERIAAEVGSIGLLLQAGATVSTEVGAELRSGLPVDGSLANNQMILTLGANQSTASFGTVLAGDDHAPYFGFIDGGIQATGSFQATVATFAMRQQASEDLQRLRLMSSANHITPVFDAGCTQTGIRFTFTIRNAGPHPISVLAPEVLSDALWRQMFDSGAFRWVPTQIPQADSYVLAPFASIRFAMNASWELFQTIATSNRLTSLALRVRSSVATVGVYWPDPMRLYRSLTTERLQEMSSSCLRLRDLTAASRVPPALAAFDFARELELFWGGGLVPEWNSGLEYDLRHADELASVEIANHLLEIRAPMDGVDVWGVPEILMNAVQDSAFSHTRRVLVDGSEPWLLSSEPLPERASEVPDGLRPGVFALLMQSAARRK